MSLRTHWAAVAEPIEQQRREQLRQLCSVRWDSSACGAQDRSWMGAGLALLEAECFLVVAMLLAALYPTEWEALA